MKIIPAAPAMRVLAVLLALLPLLNCGTSTNNGLQKITVTPANATVAKGENLQLVATGSYGDGSQQTLTDSVTWQTSKPAVATIGGQGQVTGMDVGASQMSATYQGMTGSTYVTVGSAVLVGISVSPSTSSLPVGESEQLTATGKFSDGSTQDLTQSVTWSSSGTVATVGPTGSVLAAALGTATITASSASINGTATISIGQAVLTGITVSPNTSSVPLGESEQLTATGNFSDGSTQNLTQSATWTSSGAVASVGASGSVLGSALGTATITATSGTIAGSASVTVGQAVLVGITVSPAQSSVPVGESQQLTATGTFSDGSTQNLTQSAHWTSSSANASVSSSGGVLANSVGSATIQAAMGAIAGSASITVQTAALLSLSVTPAQSTLALGQSEQLTATGNYSDGSTQNLTQSAVWSAVGGASIGSTGAVQGLSVGSATVTAASGSITGSAAVTVTPPQGDQSVYFVTSYSNNVAGAPDATVRLINDGSQGTFTAGNLYADFYVFDDSEELITCCSCTVTPDGLLSQSVGAMTATVLGGGSAPTRGVIKIVSSSNGFMPTLGNPEPPAEVPATGLHGWATHIQSVQNQNPTGPGPYSATETQIADANLTSSEQSLLETLCWVDIASLSGPACPCTPEDYDF